MAFVLGGVLVRLRMSTALQHSPPSPLLHLLMVKKKTFFFFFNIDNGIIFLPLYRVHIDTMCSSNWKIVVVASKTRNGHQDNIIPLINDDPRWA